MPMIRSAWHDVLLLLRGLTSTTPTREVSWPKSVVVIVPSGLSDDAEIKLSPNLMLDLYSLISNLEKFVFLPSNKYHENLVWRSSKSSNMDTSMGLAYLEQSSFSLILLSTQCFGSELTLLNKDVATCTIFFTMPFRK